MIDGRLRVTRGGRVSCNNDDDDNNNKQSASRTHYHYYYYYNILVHVIYICNMRIDIIDIHTHAGKKCIHTRTHIILYYI